MQNNDIIPKAPLAGIVYGQIAYWMVLLGMIIILAGAIMCLSSNSNVNGTSVITELWKGDTMSEVWETCAGISGPLHGYWYLQALTGGEKIAMLGITISCLASVLGMWGASMTMLYNPGRMRVSPNMLYFLFALIVTVILTLSALGIVRLPE
jgi:hypothetical protein